MQLKFLENKNLTSFYFEMKDYSNENNYFLNSFLRVTKILLMNNW